ncbi:MAG: transposase [Rhodothermaceae bacterium]|nr:transposase [Rhodothermaceae bacterium]MXX57656.1 transposase [Rhodothermaceae bacterium]MYD19861.1 transposase [Rhodothermaceae bacterium]MYD57050.1 transposase [Rhodothermaceae bacterium]MYI44771.1 transposase [Rhodothermaceae bacterium]
MTRRRLLYIGEHRGVYRSLTRIRAKNKTADCREQKAQRNAGFIPAERVRYRERSTVERAFGRLKNEFGGPNIRVRGHENVLCLVMFSVVVLTVDQMLRMVQ